MYQDLKSKLAMYMSSQAKKESQPAKVRTAGEDMLNGSVCYYKEKPYYVIENTYPLSYSHGGFRLGDALELDMQHLMKMCGELDEDTCINDLLFLDTETTGLSGGAGTIAFLIGAGYFEKNQFILRQYFIRDYDEEAAVLGSLYQLLREKCVLVTFNGKSFDWNLLKNRFICNRIRLTSDEPAHLDLLYPSRSIWKLKLQSCRLSSLEENILGEKRIDDIPGYMIPEIYFKYLEDRDTAEIRKVIRHNELDILSLVSLLLKIYVMLQNPLIEAKDEKELLGVGRIFEKKGDLDNVVKCYDACTDSVNSTIKSLASKRLAGVYKRNGDYCKAIDLLEKILIHSNTSNIPVMIELAKCYEHREKNPVKALKVVEEAIDACLALHLRNSVYHLDLRKRKERLQRKILKRKESSM